MKIEHEQLHIYRNIVCKSQSSTCTLKPLGVVFQANLLQFYEQTDRQTAMAFHVYPLYFVMGGIKRLH